MQIKIFTPIEDSIVGNTAFVLLPETLRVMLTPFLSALHTDGVIILDGLLGKDPIASTTLSRSGGFVRLERFLEGHPNERKAFEEALHLLAWHMGPKFTSNAPRGNIGATQYCTSCGQSAISGTSRCGSWACPSHARWKLVYPSYKMPKQPEWQKKSERDMARLAKQSRKAPPGSSVSMNSDGSISTKHSDGTVKKTRAPKKR